MNPEFANKSFDFVKDQTEKETVRLVKEGGKVVDGVALGLPHKTAKRIARQNALKQVGYTAGNLGTSNVGNMPSRRERRKNLVEFKPVYNGNEPKTHEEFYGVGNERFNNKFVTIK